MLPLLAVPTYALTEMSVSRTPKPGAEPVVLIQGRKSGLMGLLLTLLGLEPICRLTVSEREIFVDRTSLFGAFHQVIPINRVASASFGVIRPLWLLAAALISLIAAVVLTAQRDSRSAGLLLLILPIVFIVKYVVGKSAVIFVESTGGGLQALAFKGALIGGQRIDMKEAERAVLVIRDLIIASDEPAGTAKPSPTGRPAPPATEARTTKPALLQCPSCGHTRELDAKYVGKKVKCPRCNAVVQIN